MNVNEETAALIAEAREWANGHPNLRSGELMRELADALEAVTRQPSGDDREALIDVVKRNRSVVKRMSDGYPSVAFVTDETIAEAILAAGFSRATVPDAATERVTENSVRHVKRLTTELQNKRESLNDQRREFRKLLAKARAERDAALAAVERIRQAVSGHPECDRYEEGDVISCGWKSAYASVLAALDGAPEPEGGAR